MKFYVILALSLASCLAHASVSWQCSGDNIEAIGVNGSTGSVAWDCFPGGGICNQSSTVQSSVNNNGNAVFEGPYFKLVIETSRKPASDGSYRGYVSATDMQDSADMGQGMTISEGVTCTQSSGSK